MKSLILLFFMCFCCLNLYSNEVKIELKSGYSSSYDLKTFDKISIDENEDKYQLVIHQNNLEADIIDIDDVEKITYTPCDEQGKMFLYLNDSTIDSIDHSQITNITFEPKNTSGINFDQEISKLNQFLTYINAYPNPVTSILSVDFDLNETREISVIIYNETGEVIKEFENRYYAEGKNIINWDSRDNSGLYVNSGTYLIMISSINSSGHIDIITQKLIINR